MPGMSGGLGPAGEGAKSSMSTADSKHDANLKEESFEREPWFAKLPPELRKAIKARAQNRPPRGYEERLRRYFENID